MCCSRRTSLPPPTYAQQRTFLRRTLRSNLQAFSAGFPASPAFGGISRMKAIARCFTCFCRVLGKLGHPAHFLRSPGQESFQVLRKRSTPRSFPTRIKSLGFVTRAFPQASDTALATVTRHRDCEIFGADNSFVGCVDGRSSITDLLDQGECGSKCSPLPDQGRR